ncbi:MAG: hypothetical protein AAFW89_05530 [Bacteroidota bacterium]
MRYLSLCTLIILLSLGCSDSSTDNGTDEVAPSIPDVTANQPSFEFFRSKVVADLNKTTSENYQLAAILTAAVEALMTGFSTLPASFMEIAEGEEATFNSGRWRWEYTSAGGGASVSVVLTATVSIQETQWAMFISAVSPEVTFDDYRFMDGTIQNNENEGEWNFYSFEEESTTPAFTYTWDITSESLAQFTITFGDSDFSTIQYFLNGPDNTLFITSDSQQQSMIYWNSDTGAGYIREGDNQICWDATQSNITCP